MFPKGGDGSSVPDSITLLSSPQKHSSLAGVFPQNFGLFFAMFYEILDNTLGFLSSEKAYFLFIVAKQLMSN